MVKKIVMSQQNIKRKYLSSKAQIVSEAWKSLPDDKNACHDDFKFRFDFIKYLMTSHAYSFVLLSCLFDFSPGLQ